MRGTTGTTCVDDPDSARGAAEPAVPRWMVDRRERWTSHAQWFARAVISISRYRTYISISSYWTVMS